MSLKKRVDRIDMNTGFPAYGTEESAKTNTDVNAPDVVVASSGQPEASKREIETFEDGGVKIYDKDTETGNVKYYDANGAEVPENVVDILFEKYQVAPEYNEAGGEKKGDLQVREAEYKKHGNEKFADGKPPEYISERQDYTVGESWQVTVEKKYYQIVKFLRGELRPDASKKEEESNIGNEVK